MSLSRIAPGARLLKRYEEKRDECAEGGKQIGNGGEAR